MAKDYSEWLPSSNYEVIKTPNFSFIKMDQLKPGYAFSEVWKPVMKKYVSIQEKRSEPNY